jgi:hypothetical protein
MTTKNIVLVCLILAGVVAIPGPVMRAQSNEAAGRAESLAQELETQFAGGGWLERLRELRSQQLEGSWALTVSPVPPPGVPAPPPFRVYANFARGGAYLGADRRLPLSKQFGSWVHLEGNEFAATFIADLYDQSGNFTGTVKLRTRYIVTGKDEFVGVANAEERDVNGNVTATRCARFKGEHITVEQLAPPCQGLNPYELTNGHE